MNCLFRSSYYVVVIQDFLSMEKYFNVGENKEGTLMELGFDGLISYQ